LLLLGVLLVVGTANDRSNDIEPWAMFGSFGVLAVCFWVSSKFDRSAQRDTNAGLVAAAHWLGVRDAYTGAGNYEVLPPGAVVLYERHLAYATAMGVARACVQRLPLGAEDDHHAWTVFEGRWRQVDVRYPRHRCGWGTSRGRGIFTGLLWSLLLVVPFWLFSRIGSSVYDSVHDRVLDLGKGDSANTWLNDNTAHWLGLAVVAALTVAGLVIVWNGIRKGVLPLVRGLMDLGAYRRVRGRVVRVREFHRTQGDHVITDTFVAVDDGSTDRLVAWKVRNELAFHLDEGDDVVLEVSRHLGHVRSLRELVKAAAPLPAPTLEELLPPAPPAPPAPPPMPAPWWGDQSA
jgi:hypothetical protein